MSRGKGFRFAWERVTQAAEGEAEIMIYSAITSWKWDKDDPEVTAKEFDKLMKEARASGATTLRLRLNCPGGDVSQAVAMKTMIEQSRFEQVNIDIEGLCASAATFFVCIPGAHVRIAQGSEFMIHNPRAGCWGEAGDLRRVAERLEKMQRDQHEMYAGRTGQTAEKIAEWMDAETWFTAKEAKEAGFADEVLEAEPVAACADPDTYGLMRECYGRLPQEITAKAAQKEAGNTGGAATPTVPENTTDNGNEEERNLEINEITTQQLREGNDGVYQEIFQAGAAAERQRQQDIDALCGEGYEELAAQAKEKGTSAADFLRQMVAQQKQKKQDFLAQRQAETAASQQVRGGAAGQQAKGSEDDELKALASESAAYAKEAAAYGGQMY